MKNAASIINQKVKFYLHWFLSILDDEHKIVDGNTEEGQNCTCTESRSYLQDDYYFIINWFLNSTYHAENDDHNVPVL